MNASILVDIEESGLEDCLFFGWFLVCIVWEKDGKAQKHESGGCARSLLIRDLSSPSQKNNPKG